MDSARISTVPTTMLELSISCRNLPNKDTVSKSDPQCTLYIKNLSDKDWKEIGKTEVINDDLNPHFVRKFLINYNFETVQKLRFVLHDIDTVSNDFLGQLETTLAEIVAFQGREFIGPLKDERGRDAGTIIVVAEEIANCKRSVNITLKGCEILGTSCFTKRSTFLTFWRSIENGSYSLVHKTEIATASHKPEWKKIYMSARTLCNGDFDRNVRIDCMKYKMSGAHTLIGSFHTTLNDLTQRFKNPSTPPKLTLNNSKKRSIKCGHLELTELEIGDESSFLDYIMGGTQLHFAVAIDFTASNGNPIYPESLHYIGSDKSNPYELALKAVGEILRPYNSQNVYPGFGFGAKLTPQAPVSHQFPLNGNVNHPYCNGIEEIITHYRSTVSRVSFYGPTNFAPVIESTAAIARQYDAGTSYFILLIITDGIICDMPQTKQAIIEASHLPLSIIIVGVGNDDFAAMNELDSDDRLLEFNGKKAVRDIVQFVPLRNYINSSIPAMDGLAKDVLFEVPDQLTSFMRAKGIKPKKTTQ